MFITAPKVKNKALDCQANETSAFSSFRIENE